jgi:multiphosphoryl transfer protein
MAPELGVSSLQFAFICPLSTGMHARPASQFAELANSFSSDFVLTNLRNHREANVKSVLSIIAADIRHGDRCLIQVRGADEQPAHAAVRRFTEDVLPGCEVPLAEGLPPNRNATPRVLLAAGVTCYVGLQASPGISRGKVVMVRAMSLPRGTAVQIASDPAEELARLRLAMAAVRDRIREKLNHSSSRVGDAVLQADLAIANDVVFAEKISERVSLGKSAGDAVIETGEYFADLLRQSGSEYLRERASDLEEISVQILDELYGVDLQKTVLPLREPSIVVAETLGPQQLLAFDRRWLKAIVLEHSGAMSHALILARSRGIPAVVGVKNARTVLSSGQEVVVDASRGIVIPWSSSAVERFYQREYRTLERQRTLQGQNLGDPAITTDGMAFEVAANASSSEELTTAFESGADGIGLFRTEMAFLGRMSAPSEEEQFAIYVQAARFSDEHPAIIRTFDLGGDKPPKYLTFPREDNPFLGYRGVRIYGDYRDLLQTQLRAILRASTQGKIQILMPMISSLQEIRWFKAELERARDDLDRQNVAFSSDIPIGVMVEVPSAAFALKQLSAEVDFFSIGTNDLAQYFFAVDRGNSRVAELSKVLEPGFLRFLKQIVDEIHAAGKRVGMCGDMASKVQHLPLLLGLPLDGISVPTSEIPPLKRAVRRYSAAACKLLLKQALSCRESAEIEQLLTSEPLGSSVPTLLSDDLIRLHSDSQNKEEAIQEFVDSAYIAGRTQDRQGLEEALWAREAVYSTGLGFGFATPHCKTVAVAANSIGVLRFREPINWGSLDSELVGMVIFIAMREPQTENDHMQVFSRLARSLMNEEFREQLLAINDSHHMVCYLGEQLGIPVN